MIKKLKKISFKINPNEIALNQRKFDTDEIGRGVGVHKTRKGKGSYNRKGKHKMDYSRDDYGSFYFCPSLLNKVSC